MADKTITFGDDSLSVPCDTVTANDLKGMFRILGGEVTGVTVPANGRYNVAIPLNPPSGYAFGAYRQFSIQGSGRDQCAIQFFGSTGGGTQANVAVKNFSNSDAVVNINVTVLFYKEF